MLAKAFWKTADRVLLRLTAVVWVLFLIIYALRCRYLYVELREKERQKVLKSREEFHRLEADATLDASTAIYRSVSGRLMQGFSTSRSMD